MIYIIQILLLVLIVIQLVYAGYQTPYYSLKDAPSLFDKFVKDFNKVYKNKEDRRTHFEQFKKNLGKINDFVNGKNFSSIEGIDQFTDMNEKEARIYYGVVPRLRSGHEK